MDICNCPSSTWCPRRSARERGCWARWCWRKKRRSRVSLLALRLDGVITLARLRLQILVGQLDIQLAIAAVLGVVEGRVADGILAAHLVLQLFKDHIQGILAIDAEHVAAGGVGHAPQVAFAAAEGAERAAEVR